MNTNTLKITAVLLMLAGVFYSCDGNVPCGYEPKKEEVICPTKAIIGKWEFVEVRFTALDKKPQRKEPTGYIEFFADGRFGWFCYATEEFTLFETKYWLDKIYIGGGTTYDNNGNVVAVIPPEEWWILELETFGVECKFAYGEVRAYIWTLWSGTQIVFIDSDTFYSVLHTALTNFHYIHRRKK